MPLQYLKEFNNRYKHFYILSYYIVIYLLYTTLNKIIVPKYFMHSFIDDYIPFVKEMIVPYLYWYVYILASLIYLGFTNKRSFYKLAIFMFAGMTISFIIYAIFPNGQNLRPVIGGKDIFSRMVQNIYLEDNPTNSAPSMHVINAIAVHLAIINDKRLSKISWVKVSSFISAIFIIASTVMVKQHSIIDVFGGILLSFVLYVVIYNFESIYELVTSRASVRNVQSD